MLRMALDLDLRDLTGMTAAGLHMATFGGIWQAVLTGFAGVSVSGASCASIPGCPRPGSACRYVSGASGGGSA
jgi:trehalose/maltose hydrolase-like predicted phosphorylase